MSQSTLGRRNTFTSSLSSIRENPTTSADHTIQISAPEHAIQTAIHNGTIIKKQVDALLIALNKYMNPNPGLTAAQAIDFQKLKAKRKKLKEMRQHQEHSFLIDKLITRTTKKITPLKQTLFFWARGLHQLNDADFWAALDEKHDNARLKLKLHELKKLWQSQQNFSRFSTQDLLDFYLKHLQPLRRTVLNELNLKKNQPKTPSAINYLKTLNLAINKLRSQLIDAILVRLLCVEYYNDICCDDIVCYFLDRIFELTTAPMIEHQGIMRRDLNPDIIDSLVTTLEKYYAHEEYFKNLLPKLTVSNIFWTHIGPIYNPVIVFFNNIFHQLIDELLQNDHYLLNQFANNILEGINNHPQLIKMRSLLAYMQSFCDKNQTTSCHSALKKTFEIQLKNYTSTLEYINESIEKKLYELIKSLLHNLNNVDIKKHAWEKFANKLKNIKQFHREYFKINYYANNDWLFILSIYLFDLIKNKQQIGSIFCKNVVKLYRVMHPVLTKRQITVLKNHFKELAAFANKLQNEESEICLYSITHYLELPLLNHRTLLSALKRHDAIDKLLSSENISIKEDFLFTDHLHALTLYIKNVLLKISSEMSYINLDYFDMNGLFLIEESQRRTLEKRASSTELKEIPFSRLKENLEKQLSYRLNNPIFFSNYLFIGHKIDLNKLANLRKRIENFFKNKQYKSFILDTLHSSVKSLIEKYCLAKLRTHQCINISYITSVNEILNINILEQFENHAEFERLMTALVKSDDIPTAILTFLLINAFSKDHQLVSAYAKNRFTLIEKSKSATPDDYIFFAHCAKVASIANSMNVEKGKYTAIIYKHVNADLPWQAGFACLVELFGTEKLIHAYRLKGLRWLLTLVTDEISVLEGTQHFKTFMSTINHEKISKTTISTVAKNKSLTTEINKCIQKSKWSPLIENILREFGSLEQTQFLHTKLLSEVIESKINFSDTWLGQILKDKIGFDLNNKQAFYLHFFGAKNIKVICHLLEQSVKELIVIDQNINIRDNEAINYKDILNQSLGIQHLVDFYKTNGRDQSTLHFLKSIQNFIHKIYSYQKLCINLNCNADLIKISELSPKFHNTIVSIILHLDELKNFIDPTQDEVESYLNKLKGVFRELEDCLQKLNVVLNFMVVAILYNLLFCFSDKLKSLLANKYKYEFNKNPHWSTLINYFDDQKYIQRIDNLSLSLTTHQIFTAEFQSVLDFAHRFNAVKIKIQDCMKQSLLYEADIHIQRLETNWPNIIKGKKLLLLWKICVRKLRQKQLPSEFKHEYVQFLLDFIRFITDAILQRAQTSSPDLVEKLISLFAHLDQVKTTISACSSYISDSRRSARLSHLFTNINPKPLDVNCLYALMNKTFALSFILKITQFLEQLEMKQSSQTKSFSPHTSSSIAFYQSNDNLNNLQLNPLTDILAILKRLYSGQDTQKEALEKIEKIYLDATKSLGLTENKTYFKFLKKLYKNLQTTLQPSTEQESIAPKSKRFSIAILG